MTTAFTLPAESFATDFAILRDIQADPRIKIALDREPDAVYTLQDEAKFHETGGLLRHADTVRVEDRMHDWQWQAGSLRYFARVEGRVAILVVYAREERVIPARFCPLHGTNVQETPCPACHPTERKVS